MEEVEGRTSSARGKGVILYVDHSDPHERGLIARTFGRYSVPLAVLNSCDINKTYESEGQIEGEYHQNQWASGLL